VRGVADAAKGVAGATQLKLPEFANEVRLYVPEGPSHGVVVWLHGQGGYDWKKLLADWKPLCDRYNLILVAPKPLDSNRWLPSDMALIDRLLAEVTSKYDVDPTRVVVHGHQDGGTLAFLSAFHNRDVIRAVAVVEATPMGPAPENDPPHRLAVYVATAGKSPLAAGVQASVKTMREMKIPVVVKSLSATPRYLSVAELGELVRWIDTLDRI
jgi:serine protease Do